MSRTFRTLCLLSVLVLSASLLVTAEPVTLRVYIGFDRAQNPAAYDQFEDYLHDYERLHPKLTIENLGKNDDGSKLLTMLMANEAPDVIKAGMDKLLGFYLSGLLDPVPSPLADKVRRAMFPIAVEGSTVEGRLVGIPFENEVSGLVYNTERLAEGGIAAPPTTWDELQLVGQKLARYDDNKMVVPALAEAGANWSLAFHVIATIYAEGGEFVDQDGLLRWGEPATYEALERYIRALSGRPYMKLGWDAVGQFAAGNIPMAFGHPYTVQNIPPEAMAPFGATLQPKGSVTYGATYYNHLYSVPAGSKHKAESWQLLEWLALPREVEGGVTRHVK